MRISRATAHGLVAKARPVVITGQAVTPYVYDLMDSAQGQIPTKTAVTVTPKELATVKDVVGAHITGVQVKEQRVGTAPGGTEIGELYYLKTVPAPSTRTSYMQANSVAWDSELYYSDYPYAASVPRRFRAGEQVTERWMAPVLLSGLQDGDTWDGGRVRWIDDYFVFEVSPLVHRQQYARGFDSVDADVVLQRNGVEVGADKNTRLWIPNLPDDPAEFHATLTTRSGSNNAWKYSTEVKSTWTWKSKGGRSEVMPIITADIDLPTADELSRVPVGRAVPLTFGLRDQAGSEASPIASASLELSYDGTSWISVPLTKTGNGQYKASITHPKTAAGQAPFLRLSAVDANGNKVEQEVTRAYGLR
ncbi:hypothetical protein [Kribbella kalugense]|uniref:hypothetical protein n=1 Tax=Kribbella kalugense TaxID=2512221 RepID=UPI001EE06513|nr:hypothetical protein [Kribbella kalugense]